MNRLDENYKYFEDNYKKLSSLYSGLYIIITNGEVILSDKDINVIVEYAKKLEAGTYIIQKCEKNPQKNIQMYHTRVSFQ